MRLLSGLTALALLPALFTMPPAAADPNCPVRLDEPTRGRQAIAELGDDLTRAARRTGHSAASLRTKLRTDPTFWLDPCATPFYVEPTNHQTSLFTPAIAPADAFALHSRPGSQRTLYLDFDGVTIPDDSRWAAMYEPFTAPGYSIDNKPEFNDAEKAHIADIWARVAEDYAPFDVDVTTEDPGDAAITRDTDADEVYGTRVAIVGSNPISDTCNCGGIAFVNVFNLDVIHEDYQPAFAFTDGVGTDSKYVAEVASHEAGHNLGLYHDGTTSAPYYRGRGAWAPIMGASYYRPLTQWSKGDYSNANNREDDLSIISQSGAPLMADDHGDSSAASTNLAGPTVGLIGSTTDVDWFRFSATEGTAVSVEPAATSPNLDVRLDLFDASGALLASDDPRSAFVEEDVARGLSASLTQDLPAGVYFAKVDGTGSASSDGYTDYGSLGTYTISVSTNAAEELAITGQILPSSVVDSTYRATLAATGGIPPYSYAVTGGELAYGLTLNADGTITGQTLASGSTTFTATVTDSASVTDTAEFTIDVANKPAPEAPPVTPVPTPTSTPTPDPTPTQTIANVPAIHFTMARPLAAARVGTLYRKRLTATNARTWRLSFGKLPAGVRLTSNGVLRGRPSKAGRYRVGIVATGSQGQSATTRLTIRVRSAKR